MKRTIYLTQRSGVLADSDLMRSRWNSRSARPVLPPEPVVWVDFGDTVDAVDSGWRYWNRNADRVA
jgi:hypothetical protein